MHTTHTGPASYPPRRRRISRWWLLPAAGTPALTLAAWLWVGVARHASLVKISGGEAGARTALLVGVTVVFLIAAGGLSAVAAVLAGRPRRRAVAADLAAAEAAGEAGYEALPLPAVTRRRRREPAGPVVAWQGSESGDRTVPAGRVPGLLAGQMHDEVAGGAADDDGEVAG